MGGRLTVEPGGHLEADGRLDEVIIAGTAGGALEISGTLTVRSTGAIEGRIQSARLRVEEGARIQGAIHPLRSQSSS
jgi:cytoskeletal protein CcmA (bactofilin family)